MKRGASESGAHPSLTTCTHTLLCPFPARRVGATHAFPTPRYVFTSSGITLSSVTMRSFRFSCIIRLRSCMASWGGGWGGGSTVLGRGQRVDACACAHRQSARQREHLCTRAFVQPLHPPTLDSVCELSSKRF